MTVKLDDALHRLNRSETLLIDFFRLASPEDQLVLLEMAKTAAELRPLPAKVIPFRQSA